MGFFFYSRHFSVNGAQMRVCLFDWEVGGPMEGFNKTLTLLCPTQLASFSSLLWWTEVTPGTSGVIFS